MHIAYVANGINIHHTGGDLVFFIEGLQKAVKEVKTKVGEEVDEEEVVGNAAV